MALAAESLTPSEKKIISVGDLTRKIKKSIEDSIRYVWVAGEMSNYKGPGPSGQSNTIPFQIVTRTLSRRNCCPASPRITRWRSQLIPKVVRRSA